MLVFCEGRFDFYGLYVFIMWMYLNFMVEVGVNEFYLIKQVVWKLGDKIILVLIGKLQCEFEELMIIVVCNNNYMLEVFLVLKYKYIFIVQMFEGNYVVEMCVEVGLFMRNVCV